MSRAHYDPGYFYPLDGKPKRPKFAAWDIESKDGDSQKSGFTRPFQVGFFDGERYHCFFDTNTDSGMFAPQPWQRRYRSRGGCVDRFMRFVLREKYRGFWFYAHNGGNFDFLFILPWLAENAERMGLVVSLIPAGSSGLLAIDVYQEKCKWNRWRFVDSVKLLPMTLKKAASAFGVGKKYELDGEVILAEDGLPFSMDREIPESDPGWVPYNESDCRLLYGVVEKAADMVENVFGGELALTAPSTAIRTIRRAFLPRPIERNVESHAFIRRGYVGGRTEKFFNFGTFLRYVDVNSSYVHSMTMAVPAGDGRQLFGEPPDSFKESRIGFCEVTVHVPEDCPIPPLPVRACDAYFPRGSGVEGKLVFPVGKLKGVWEWDELQHAMATCGVTILEWHESWWYRAEPLLKEFVETLYKYRHKAKCFKCSGKLRSSPEGEPFWCRRCRAFGYDAALDAWAKLLGNSSYGRFAMNPERVKLYWRNDPEMPEGAEPLVDGDPESQLWYKEEEADDPAIMPQISARITALSRVLLHRYALDAISRVNRRCEKCHSCVTFRRQGRGRWSGDDVRTASDGRSVLPGRKAATEHGCGVERPSEAGAVPARVLPLALPVGGTGPHGDFELCDGEQRIGWTDPLCPCGGVLMTRQCRVYYMDTDSLMTDAFMESSSELGALKDEIPRYAGYLEGRFYAPKLYRLSVDERYAELPEHVRRAMLLRDKDFLKKLAEAAEEKHEEMIAKAAEDRSFELIKAKGFSRELRTAKTLDTLYDGAVKRLQWLSRADSRNPDGTYKEMPEDIKTAGTVWDTRLEKSGTLASMIQRDEHGKPILRQTADGTYRPISDAFGRGPLMVKIPKRLHLQGAKRVENRDGSTTAYVIDMTVEPPAWWKAREAKRQARKELMEERKAAGQ